MRFTASELADHLRGRLEGDDATVDGASIDSRTVERGQLFVPIVGARDGHEWRAEALAAGAAAYLTQLPPVGGSAIVVADTTKALTSLASLARMRFGGEVLGVTGSVGKTTVKELVSAVLATCFATTASERSFNNELGVPLTILNAPEECDWLVLELGARGIGHIRHLTGIAQPVAGIVTSVGLAHLEMFHDLATVALAKGELVQSLPSDGIAVLNMDDPRVAAMADHSPAPVLGYGTTPLAEVAAEDIELDDEARGRFTLRSPWGRARVALQLHGRHQVSNALAAAAAGLWCGVPIDSVAGALGDARGPALRTEFIRTPAGARLISDYYNANPTSTEAALHTLAATDAERKVALLGVMAELGEQAGEHHQAMRVLADSLGIELVAYRTDAYGEPAVETVEEALELVKSLTERDALLVKGSRVAAMEMVVRELSA